MLEKSSVWTLLLLFRRRQHAWGRLQAPGRACRAHRRRHLPGPQRNDSQVQKSGEQLLELSVEDEKVDLVRSWIQLKQILGFSNAPTAPLSYQLGSLKSLPLEILTLTVATFTSMPALGADWIFVRPHGQTPSGPTVVSLYWLVCWACLLNSSDSLSDNRHFDLN